MEQNRETGGSRLWPLAAVAAGVFGYAGSMLTASSVTDAERATGAGVIEALDRTTYQIGVVAGITAVFFLLLFAAGWRRWSATHAPQSLSASMVSLALTASAGAMILAYGMKGMFAVYLPGGADEGMFPLESLHAIYMFDDLGPFMAWYGVTMAAAVIVWIALRERTLPIWLGIVSLLFVLPPVAVLVLTGLSGFPGVISPLWMIITGVGLTVSLRRAGSTASQPATYAPVAG